MSYAHRAVDGGVDELELPLRVLTIALGLSLWVAVGSVTLAVADGLGATPTRRLLLGVVLVALMVGLLWQRRRICQLLWVRPWLIIGLGVVQLAVAIGDGAIGSPYLQNSLTSIGIATVVARPRTARR